VTERRLPEALHRVPMENRSLTERRLPEALHRVPMEDWS
jgi:hypothetical protein